MLQTQTDRQTAAPAWYVLGPGGVDPERAPVPTGGDLVLTRPVSDEERWAVWLQARDDWLASKSRRTGSASTVRAYTYAWDEFFGRFLPETFGKPVGPWGVGKTHVHAYQRELEETIIGPGLRNAGQPLAATTINARLAAISSYYSYCNTQFTVWHQGREIPLAAHNPAKAVERAKTTPYGKARSLGPDEIRRLLLAINRDCLRGKRDFALITTYLYTGRRAGEVVRLRWGDIREEAGRMGYRWHGKGGKSRRDELPPPVYRAICDYLRAAGRLADIQDNDYIWTALSDNAARLPNVDADDYDPDHHISTGMANAIVKKLARRAGLDDSDIKTHTLRHTAATLRRLAGDDPLALSQFLAHSNLAVTQIYLEHREVRRDHSWSRVEELLEGA